MTTARLPVLGLAGTLALAYGADRLVAVLREQASRSMAFDRYLWLAGLANLLVAACMLAMAWLVTARDRSQPYRVGWLFLALGLGLTPATPLRCTFSAGLLPLGLAEHLTADSRTVFASAFVCALGAARAVPGKDAQSTHPHTSGSYRPGIRSCDPATVEGSGREPR